MDRLTATTAIVLLTIAVSALVTLSPYATDIQVLAGFIPARLSGAVVFPGLTAVPAWLTPLSCALIHAGFFHLGMNMLMLGFTGSATERALGPVGIIVLYLVGAYAAAFAQWAAGPLSVTPMVGASGAASAVVGAYSLLYGQPKAKAIGPIPARAIHILWLAVAWTLVNLLMATAFLQGGVAIAAAAHIGGFFAGLALAGPLFRWRWRKA
ncbi:rhomboid family intramembrane serine protease [Sphingomonas sp. JC676]|uniref:rhomboid family intramembrane serine protease n=1 Tax=Sphingomonas sp. JC676 TaxID=2768065 RepID=UPI0016579ACC|nr:rhomboid family intramembrane serine protease [Sphingomonas sp. JC676]MBC9031592.1 rhomboid family intramembrane serine protease [Sphingomonas sp. JC676]